MLMSIISPKTLTPSPPFQKHQNPKILQFQHQRSNLYCKSELQTERGLEFETGDSFFRHESATGRDLGVLSAYIYKQSQGRLRVLDAMCGSGVRACRYLREAEADFVLANDANDWCRGVILGNLKRVVDRGFGDERRWDVFHLDAKRVLTECYLQRDFFDFIDIDSFGSDSSMFLRSAMSTLKLGGLLYVTSTDGYSSGGHRPQHSLDAYGAFVRPMPCSNEIGLRVLIGGAVREAAVLGYNVTPLFSYYSYHGPVFRVLLQVNRGKLQQNRYYGFISYCNLCGHSESFSWEDLGRIGCSFCGLEGSGALTVSGPLWTGPLHATEHIKEMLEVAKQWEWTGNEAESNPEKLLKRMLDESNPALPFGYIKLDELASRGKFNSPSVRILMSAIMEEGYVASRSHITSNAIKTNCPVPVCIRIAKQLQGIV